MTRRSSVVCFTMCVLFLMPPDVPAAERQSTHARTARTDDDGLPSGAEFPPHDRQVLSSIRQGAAAKVARRRLRESPDSLGTFRLLATQERTDEMLRVLHLLVRNHPEQISEAFELLLSNMTRIVSDESRGYNARLSEIVAAARQQLPRLDAERAARVVRVLLIFDELVSPHADTGNDLTRKLRAFIQQHPGTEAALLAEVELVAFGATTLEQLDALEALARAHPRTVAGAEATYLRASDLAIDVAVAGIEKDGSDPTDRFMQVLQAVRDLESGAYPPCEWVDRAPSLIWEFSTSEPAYSSENLERMLTASYDFVKTHFTLADNPAEESIGYYVTDRMPVLMRARGDEIAGMEDLFARLERDVADAPAVRYLKAEYYRRNMREPQFGAGRIREKAIATLSTLQAQGRGLYHRKALATLAALRLEEGDVVNARIDLVNYLQRYPDSAWAWIAALRVGLIDQELGDVNTAASTHLAAAARYGSNPVARVLGHAFAARAFEAQGRFGTALREYRKALGGWDSDYGPAYSIHSMRYAEPTDSLWSRDPAEVSSEALSDRIAQLKQSLAQPGGALLERGRELLERQQRQDAIATLKQLLAAHPSSGAAAEARYLVHRAQLEAALDLADEDRARAESSAVKLLESLGRERVDFAVTVAKIARACLLWKRGEPEAVPSMRQALEEWQAQQHVTKAANRLEQDVADVRDVLFLPNGGSVFGSLEWNAFDWPAAPPPFVVVNPDVRVKLGDGDIVRVSVRQPLRTESKVLFFNNEQLELLRATMVRLGGSRTRVATAVTETPNQPVGASLDLMAFWNKFFLMRAGHWGGWGLDTYPAITSIEFIDAARTRAEVAVTIGYSGATVVIEKEGRVWTAKRLINRWIT
jgi:tetratricopeptide (TPR) repeat protein